MISRKTLLGEIIEKYPEVSPVLASAGLHCIGCHVSTVESIEDGCSAHGFSSKEIEDIIKKANERILLYDTLPKISFTPRAVLEFEKRIKKEKSKFIKIEPTFGGEFDFVPLNDKLDDDIVVESKAKEGTIIVLIAPRIERMLRSLVIDFNEKINDFVATKVSPQKNEKSEPSKKSTKPKAKKKSK